MTSKSIIIAFAKEEVSQKVKRMLDSCGITVYAVCRSINEVIRAAMDVDSVLIVMGFKLTDGTVNEIGDSLPKDSAVVVIAKPEQQEAIYNENIVFMPLPINRNELAQTIQMVTGSIRKRKDTVHKPMRTEADRKLIEEAKLYLMENYRMTEVQAHRFIQKKSMDTGARFVDTAKLILG